jgi:hypothetical protein
MAHMRALGWLYSQAARISQLEAGLAEATDDMAHEYGDDEATVVRLRALLKGQS